MSNLKGIFHGISAPKLSAFFVVAGIFSASNLFFVPRVAAQTFPIFEPFEVNNEESELFCETTPQLPVILDNPSEIFTDTKNLIEENPQEIIESDQGAAVESAPQEENIQAKIQQPPIPEPAITPQVIPKPVVKPAPKPLPTQPKIATKKTITAPKPFIYKKNAQGQLVCATKNDKPHKSARTNKVHMDMECCLDPDEIPNPHCYYPPSKYGKLLSKLGR